MATKAYMVECGYGDKAEVVFAENGNKARAQCSHCDAFHDVDYIDLRARRAKEFDGRESNPPTLAELVLKHGWHVECECGRQITNADDPEFNPDGDRCERCNDCGSKCENCKKRVPEGIWACDRCMAVYDGDDFRNELLEDGSAGVPGAEPRHCNVNDHE